MAKYFKYFPKTFYTAGDNLDTVTNLIARFSFERNFQDNSSIYYEYSVQESDTPEIIASKYYENPERHWIVLMFNQIIDPQFDWPLQYNTLIEFIDKKYTANANTQNNQTGLAWSQQTTKNYFKIVTRSSSDGTQIIEKLNLDANTYVNVATSSNNYTLDSGDIVSVVVTKETQSYYDYEIDENEKKRQIKLLKPEFVSAVEQEFRRVIA